MMKMLNIKRLGAILAFGLLVSPAFSQAPVRNHSTGLPFDETNKMAWIQAHPAEYQSMSNKPTEKINTSPMTEAEKLAWVTSHPAEYARLTTPVGRTETTVILPAVPSFPVYINTGNPDQDAADYSTRKQVWIANNPAEYNTMNQGQSQQGMSREDRLRLIESRNK